MLVAKTSDDLNYGEGVGDVITSFTDSDLPTILSEEEFDTGDDETDYDQSLTVANSTVGELTFGQNEDNNDQAESFFMINKNAKFYEYEVDFDSTIDFDEEKDLESEKITIQDQEYTITDVSLATDSSVDEITLMAGDTTVWLREGDSITRMMNGEEHTVEVSDVTEQGTACGVFVDGSASPVWIDEGKTETVNGLEVGVIDARAVNSQLQDSDVCEINIGADEIILEDGQEVQVSGVDIDGSNVVMNTAANQWSGFTISQEAEDDVYLSEGDEWTDPVFGNWKLDYQGMVADYETMEIDVAQEDGTFTFTNLDGDEVEIPFVLYDAGGDNDLVLSADTDLESYMIFDGMTNMNAHTGAGAAAGTYECGVTGLTSGDNNITEVQMCEDMQLYVVDNEVARVLEISDVDWDGNESNKADVDFEDVTTGKTYENVEVPVGAVAGVTTETLDLGSLTGVKIGLEHSHNDATNHWGAIVVDTLGDDVPGDARTHTEAQVNITNMVVADAAGTTVLSAVPSLNISEDDGAVATDVLTIGIEFGLNTDGDELEISGVTNSSGGAFIADSIDEDDDNDDKQYTVTPWGTQVVVDDDKNVDISYPAEEVYGQLFIAPVEASVTSSESGSYQLEKINVGSAKLDTEISNFEAQNMLVVGGPCINRAAAHVMGTEYAGGACAEGFEPGVGFVRFMDNGNNVALLVAGHSALDTRAATRVLANYQDYELNGQEMEVTYTDLNNIDVRAPMLE
jgi:hypothetical protein